ncbi:MAG: tetraacyldisaccharide 4'-kinase [Proteobacteria bacterium]|nr:tetraacyldisaccharide 4'-kinase [Pseudomonadota bacterium]MBU1419275.1 tetraacyldisaccharide 4'-kinase [Pseudomonadota bacterium]MBU1453218.1 tetraacyldisaccharide 4'-kinase [Pseudomonadota bacterium]
MADNFSNLFFLGRPFSPLYSAVMKARETLYLKGLKHRYQLPVPIISVGNLTMGGTGKTPVVAYLASLLLKKGLRPAIISRGYGGAAGNKVNVVSDGKTIFLDASAAGDEPCFLAKSLPGVPVLTGIVKILPCRHAIDKLGCNILLLDDGFQHLSVQRDLDLVLFSGAKLAGNSRVFPGGDLREPVSALKRCHGFMLTGITDANRDRCTQFRELLQQRFPQKPVFLSTYQPVGANQAGSDELHNLSSLPTPLYGFSGIAQPELFRNSLEENGISLSGFMALKDHQAYSQGLLKKINKQAERCGASALITTEKDLIKLQSNSFQLPCFALKMDVHPDPSFVEFINGEVEKFCSRYTVCCEDN